MNRPRTIKRKEQKRKKFVIVILYKWVKVEKWDFRKSMMMIIKTFFFPKINRKCFKTPSLPPQNNKTKQTENDENNQNPTLHHHHHHVY